MSDVVVIGKIFTARRESPFAEAMAVANGRVMAIGAKDQVLAEVGPNMEIQEAHGLVTPGFIDAHVHTASSGLDKLRLSFDDVRDAEGAVRAIAEYASLHPELPWLIGAGWSQAWFDRGCPGKELIDQVVPDRPVSIMNTDGHGLWVNSKALHLAGIDEGTDDPVDGRIERLGDGSPQGTLHEGAAKLIERVAPDDTIEDFVAGLRRGQQELFQYGVTGWQDAAVTSPIQEAYLTLGRSGELRGRVVGALWWERERGIEQVGELIERRDLAGPGFRPTSVKLMLDGVFENFTASMIDPYLDSDGRSSGHRGIDFIEREALLEIVPRLDAEGFQCHFHAIGDQAVRNALDAVEAARRSNGPTTNRHHIAHIQVVHPDDITRFAELEVAANAQPLWACNDDYQIELTTPFLGPERVDWQYPFGALVSSGARVGMGSDWGVSTANVMEEIDVAVHRTCPEGEPLGPQHALDPLTALTAFTAGSAYINHAESETGTLAHGAFADYVIFDRDPLDTGVFRDAKVVRTVIGGETVYPEE